MAETELLEGIGQDAHRIVTLTGVQALPRYAGLRWRTESGVGDAVMHYAIISGDRETGRLHIVAVIIGGRVDRPHRHKGAERIKTASGVLVLNLAEPIQGVPLAQHPGDDEIVLPDQSEHWPGSPWWWGEYEVDHGIEFLDPEGWGSAN